MWGKITARRDGDRWVAQAFYRDYDGVNRRVRRWGSTKGQSLASLHDALQNRRQPTGDGISSETRLAVLAEHWMETKRSEGLAYRTITRYEDVIGPLIKTIGQLRVREATTGTLDKYLNAIAATTPANAKTASSVLSGMFSLAARHDAVAVNPVKAVQLPKITTPEVVALSPEQFIQFRQILEDRALANHRTNKADRQVLLDIEDFLISTGVRPAEALATQFTDIDFTAGTTEINGTVYRKKAKDGGGLHIQPHTKSSDDRKLQLPSFCLTMLARRKKGNLSSNVFESNVGTIMDPNTYATRRRNLLKGTGFEWVTPKIARKSVAALIDAELDSMAAAEQLGQSGDKITKKHYIPKVRKVVDNASILEIFSNSKPSVNRQSHGSSEALSA